jgi:hypothetical protein
MTKETMPTQMQVGNSLFLTLENVQKKLSESKSEIKTMILGYESPIRNMTKDDILSSLSIALPICAELYCGIRKSEFNETVMVEAIQFIYNYYGELGAVEIKQAFEMASANKFEKVDMKAYYGQFNISMLGDILSAYKSKRNNVMNKVISEHEKNVAGDTFWNEVEHKNYLARQKVIAQFQDQLDKKRKGLQLDYKHWDELWMYWAKILVDQKIVELPEVRRRQLWSEAKDIVLKRLRKTAGNFEDFYEAKSARFQLKSLENKADQTLQQKAEVIYTKLFVWEFLK